VATKKRYKTAAWTRSEGKDPEGGLNAKGRASAKRQGMNLKPPQPGGGPRKRSFCARSAGQMKKFPAAAKDPNSRLRKARRKWKC
jgi:ribosomal protein S12